MRYIMIYVISINIGTFLMFAFDKQKAIHHGYRTPEMTLLWGCLIGGGLGGFLAMYVCHHKTHKKKFTIGIPIIILCHVLIGMYLVFCVYRPI